MKIQLITQNIKPVGLNTQTNSNPILKNTTADSFERQSNVAFKGAAADAAEALKDVMKSYIFAATNGDKVKLGFLCKDLPTFKTTLTILRGFLEENYQEFMQFSSPEGLKVTREEALKAFVVNHNNLDYASRFWGILTDTTNPNGRRFITELQETDDNRVLVHSVAKLVAKAREKLMSDILRERMTVEEWAKGLMVGR